MNDDKTRAFLKEAMERRSVSESHDAANREAAHDDLQFIAGEQWPSDAKQAREENNQPCLTINRMPQFVRQVTGDIRRSNPAIDVIPGDGDAPEEMAELYNGLIRGIEYQCDASSVYERAAESAAACGIGHFRVNYGMTARGNEISVAPIPNPFAVIWDPDAKEPTRKDAAWCFVVSEVTREEFEEAYPKADNTTFPVPPEYINQWASGNKVSVAEYFWKSDEGVQWSLISGSAILEGPQEFPSEHLPIIPVVGEEIHIGDRVVRSSVIRHAKDAQRLYNYWRSAQAEVIALQPKAPFIATATQIKGYEDAWANANNASTPVLPYNPDPEAPGPPQRSSPPVASSGLMQEVAIAADDLKATTGIYDAALGNSGNEQSGVAIRQRQMESDVSTSIYVDNLSKSIAQCGRVMVSMIPEIYDTTRAVRIVGVDGSTALETLNQPMMGDGGMFYANDLSVGAYDVRVRTGPSYSTQRQEAASGLLEFVQAVPQAAPLAADIIARNLDFPGADDLADRLKKILPPGVAENDEEPTPEEQQAMQMQQQQAQQQQQLAQAMQMAEVKKATAEAQEAEADAQKAGLEVAEQSLTIAAQTGELEAIVTQAVTLATQQALAAILPRRGPF